MADKKAKANTADDTLNLEPKKGFLKRFKTLFLILGATCTVLFSICASIGATLYLTQDNTSSQSKGREMQEKIAELETRIVKQDALLATVTSNTEELKTYLRHSSASSIKNIMLNQEKNIQSFLIILKASLRDLSIIVGREADDWQRDYDTQLTIAIQQSQKREELLKLLKTGEPPAKQ